MAEDSLNGKVWFETSYDDAMAYVAVRSKEVFEHNCQKFGSNTGMAMSIATWVYLGQTLDKYVEMGLAVDEHHKKLDEAFNALGPVVEWYAGTCLAFGDSPDIHDTIDRYKDAERLQKAIGESEE